MSTRPKLIKFLIKSNEQPIRSLEDLQKNFNIDDVLALYKEEILHRWLKAHGYDKELSSLSACSGDDVSVARKLINIFALDSSKTSVDDALCAMSFRKKEIIRLKELQSYEFAEKKIISAYHEGYRNLQKEIVENCTNMSFLRQAAENLEAKYLDLLRLDFEMFYAKMHIQAPCIFLPLLAKERTRQLCFQQFRMSFNSLPNAYPNVNTVVEFLRELLADCFETDANNAEMTTPVEHMRNMAKSTTLKIVVKDTEDSWDDIELDNNKQVMVLYAPVSSTVRALKNKDSEMFAVQANIEFPIFNGLEFRNNSEANLVYMEV